MRNALILAAAGMFTLAGTAYGQITRGIPGNQTRVPTQPGTSTFGGLLGRTGNAPPVNNPNPADVPGNPANNAGNGGNVVNGPFNPLGAFGTQFAPQLPGGNSGNNGDLSMEDIMRMRMMQSMGRNRRGPQTGAPIFGGNMGPQPGMNPGAAAQGGQVLPLFNAQAEKEAEKAKARQRAEDIRAKDNETREKRKAKALEAKKKADEDKAAREAEADAAKQ